MSLKLYKSYNFVDKDPVIDVVRTIIDDSGMKQKKISAESNVSLSTIQSWLKGRTKRPQFATVAAVVRCCGANIEIGGYSVKPKRMNGRRRNR